MEVDHGTPAPLRYFFGYRAESTAQREVVKQAGG